MTDWEIKTGTAEFGLARASDLGGEESKEQTGVWMMSLSIILAVAATAALLFLAVWMKKGGD